MEDTLRDFELSGVALSSEKSAFKPQLLGTEPFALFYELEACY